MLRYSSCILFSLVSGAIAVTVLPRPRFACTCTRTQILHLPEQMLEGIFTAELERRSPALKALSPAHEKNSETSDNLFLVEEKIVWMDQHRVPFEEIVNLIS